MIARTFKADESLLVYFMESSWIDNVFLSGSGSTVFHFQTESSVFFSCLSLSNFVRESCITKNQLDHARWIDLQNLFSPENI